MTNTQGIRGHDEARRLANVLAAMRMTPPAGLEDVAALTWDRIASIGWSSDDATPTITIEIMAHRSADSDRVARKVEVGEDHPQRGAMDEAIAGLAAIAPGARLDVTTMVAYPGWTATAETGDGWDAVLISTRWEAPESLALRTEEWEDFIVQRDADDHGHGEYLANMLVRASDVMERRARDMTGYHRHWNRVDAEMLRRMARDRGAKTLS